MKRVQCFIDGFNLYHAVDDLGNNSLKWLNLRGLSEAFIKPSQEELLDVFYFSAYATWIENAYKRHKLYIEALKSVSVTSVLGQFKEKNKKCQKCKTKWIAHEEKESDVNLALYIVQQAYEDSYDKAMIITADSDICPAIKMVKNAFPQKEIIVLVPPNRYDITRELRETTQALKIRLKHLCNNRLPEKIVTEEGAEIRAPKKYKDK